MHFDQGVQMYKLWRKPRPFLAAAAIAGLTLALAGTASAQATVGTFYNQETITGPDVSCTGLSGTVTNTITDAGRFVANADGTFHVSGTTTQDYRTVWSDGSYQINHSPSHFEFNTNATGEVVSTVAQQDRGTLYTADGQVIGNITVFTLTHVTWRDLNGNGQPDPGEFTATVDQFRVTCP
jgi:hypothetical protein